MISSVQLRMMDSGTLDSGFQHFIIALSTPKATTQATTRNMVHDIAHVLYAYLNTNDVTTLTNILAKGQVEIYHIDVA